MGKPFVSVLIDTYNHERFIEEAIVSALEQDFPASDRQILVVDDGSSDRTPEIVRKFEPHVRLLRKENGGQASAFNAGIPECRGEVVAFLDGDDWWQKSKVSVVSSELAAYPEIGTIGHGLYEVDESGKTLASNTPDRSYETRLKDTREAQEFISLRSFLGTSRLTVRRRILQHVTPLPEALCVEADELLATHAAAVGGARVLQRPLTNYRLHSGNLYQFSEWSREKAKRKYDSLACFLRDLSPRLTKAGVPEGVIHILTDCVRLDVERLGLALGKGWPWDTVRVERKAGQQAYGGATFGYHLFQAAVLGAAAVLPPALFYRMRRWYTKKGLARARQIVGSPKPIPSLVVRTQPTHDQN
ncbi:MAG TPA: glycosyltransferase [Candidatus Bathyarchaeia archaeon]|nr:glycosyltransferase [Candidatus Bathyarchaeia archaeon]